MVLADERLKHYESLMREAGAVYVTSSPRQLDGLAHLVRSHFERVGAAPRDVCQDLWEALPWSESATA
jgi:hypothetical protein